MISDTELEIQSVKKEHSMPFAEPKPKNVLKPFVKDSIQQSLEIILANNPTYQNIAPTQEEIQHVSVLFKDRKLDNIDVINYKLIADVGRNEFNNLNTQLKNFTSKMTEMKSPGLFTLIDQLTKEVSQADLEGIWEKTVNAKPSLKARFLSIFNSSAKSNDLQNQYLNVYKLLTERSKGLEAKLSKFEQQLVRQKHEQENNISALNTSYEMYFNSFVQVRQQFVFILYLEEFYKQEFNKYKEENPNQTDLHVSKKINEYDGILKDIENKRLVLHGALIRFPLTVKQNENLMNVCKNILKEIDNTLLNNFTNIRSNLLGLGISLNAQQALLGTNEAKTLDKQSAELSSRINGQLTIAAERYAAQSRLQEAEVLQGLVSNIKRLNEDILHAKTQNEEDIQKATDILNETTNELKYILGKN